MTGFERFNDGAKRAAKRVKHLPIINPEKLKNIHLADLPPALPKKRTKQN